MITMASKMRLSHADYTVGWICALPLEMAAAKLMLDEVHENLPLQSSDQNNYIFGNIERHNIVIACLPSGVYGIASAATVAMQLRSSFHSIRFGLMVGIGGGVPSKDADPDIRLGDVVVSVPTNTDDGAHGGVVQYDYGKAMNNGIFQRTGTLNSPPPILLTALSKLRTTHYTEESRVPEFLDGINRMGPKQAANFARPTQADCLYMTDYHHVIVNSHNCDGCDKNMAIQRTNRVHNNPEIHYGVIASANQVMKDSHTRDKLGCELGALCVEMEAAGLMNNYPCLVVRGICDYADSHKNEAWQGYAAADAAAFTKELLLATSVKLIEQAQTVQRILSDSDTNTDETSENEEILENTANVSYRHRRKCYKCEKYGHWKSECPVPTCTKCGEVGHWRNECPVPTCWKCGEVGHWRNECSVPTCWTCKENGHLSKECPVPTCWKCKSLGHYATTCTRQNGYCFKCGDWGHFAETCWK
ncbi:nucleoside phosphorylase domain-containing protein [Aspergillus taichungensis]|uniref:Nucleoside phosphorylase domain-containing protein n=1 Tax=Aspergillus taichungensis TaxID=482145 RepID=A0A2J5HYQ1_9EURO|nr:nucleoside phosphorylase domain-containing protein [Aspergillus taichungensis]